MNNRLQDILNSIVGNGETDIIIVDAMNTVVASSSAQIFVGTQYKEDDAIVKRIFYCNQTYFAIFPKDTDQAFINLFSLYFAAKGSDSLTVGGVPGMYYEIFTGSLTVSAAIERASQLGYDFLSKCIPVFISSISDNYEISLVIDEYIESIDMDDLIRVMLSTNEIVLICKDEMEDVQEMAESLLQIIESECAGQCLIGIGRRSNNIFELADIYKEISLALRVDPLFDAGKQIINLEEYSMGRLIRELDEDTCRKFLSEVMGDFLDEYEKDDCFDTINTFFKCNLNISEAAREMFIHRNTLIYRLDKIKKLTGYDITEFDDAFVFKWATMLHKYLSLKGNDRGSKSKKNTTEKRDESWLI